MHTTPIELPLLATLLLGALAALCLVKLFSRQAASERWRRLSERVVLAPIAILSVVLSLASIANALTHRYYAAHFTPPGRLYTVDGSTFHLQCTGEGSPTIILEAGLGSGALSWGMVQPELSGVTRVCAYDRAGLGWSSPRSDVRDAAHVESELTALLGKAGIEGPLVLVGHSLGGLYARLYASRHPDSVAGLVLIDSATPTDDDVDSSALKTYLSHRESNAAFEKLLAQAVFILGIPRLTGSCSEVPKGFPATTGRMRAEDLCDPNLSVVFEESAALSASRAQVASAFLNRNLPVLIISQDTAFSAPLEVPPILTEDWARNWDRRQESLKSLSTLSRRVVAKGSEHFIPLDRPDVVAKEVDALIQYLHGKESTPPWGSTTTD